MEINGVAHIILTVRDMLVSAGFYKPLLEQLGLTRVVDQPDYLYYVGGRTAVGLRPAAAEFVGDGFVQARCGLHHVCFRARSREDVDTVHTLLAGLSARVIHAPREEGWVPGYYSVLFEDPDGIRLEVNYVPGKGVFAPDVQRRDSASPGGD
jgi:catechol 2,3-dioxygenase-like lactoylglutathione lyase family enzyme